MGPLQPMVAMGLWLAKWLDRWRKFTACHSMLVIQPLTWSEHQLISESGCPRCGDYGGEDRPAMKLCTQSIRKVNAGSATEWIVGCGGALIGNFEVGRHGLPSTPRAVFSADLQTIGTLVQALKTIARKPFSSPTPFVENLQN